MCIDDHSRLEVHSTGILTRGRETLLGHFQQEVVGGQRPRARPEEVVHKGVLRLLHVLPPRQCLGDGFFHHHTKRT